MVSISGQYRCACQSGCREQLLQLVEGAIRWAVFAVFPADDRRLVAGKKTCSFLMRPAQSFTAPVNSSRQSLGYRPWIISQKCEDLGNKTDGRTGVILLPIHDRCLVGADDNRNLTLQELPIKTDCSEMVAKRIYGRWIWVHI